MRWQRLRGRRLRRRRLRPVLVPPRARGARPTRLQGRPPLPQWQGRVAAKALALLGAAAVVEVVVVLAAEWVQALPL